MADIRQNAPSRIVIAGGGVPGWMAAAALSKALRGEASILVVEGAEGPDPFGAADASLPSIRQFHAMLGIEEAELVAHGQASFGLGIVFTGWLRAGQSYIQPFGDVGAPIGPVAFHQLAGRARAEGAPIRLADYSLAALCAQAGRFAHPSADGRSVLSTYDYALHLDLSGYASMLRKEAERHGAAAKSSRVADLIFGDAGEISSLRLSNGESVEGDLFLDCTGPAARLIGALEPDYVDWSHWLPCDQALSMMVEAGDPELYVQAEANPAGWRRTVPLQGRRCETLIYAGGLMGSDAAEAELRKAVPASPSQPLSLLSFRPGHRRRPWSRNCVALGAAAALLEPTDSTTLHLLQRSVTRLVSLFPATPGGKVESAEYNRLTIAELERARDMAILHYKANARQGEPLWDRCREMEVPDTLAWKMELYRSRGRVPLYDEEVFEEPAWVTVFDEQELRPRRYDALASGIDVQQMRRHFERLREVIIGAARTLPSHGDYLRRIRGRAAR